MELKVLSLADKELIKEFFTSVFTKEPWNDDWSDKAQLDAYIVDLIGNVNSVALGYFDADSIVGLAMGYIKHWYRGTELILNEFCIASDRQHEGFGTAFMKSIKEYLLSRDIHAIYLLTEKGIPAYDFYKKLGFYEYTTTVPFADVF